MIKGSTISKIYASALLDTVKGSNDLQKISNQLREVCDVISNSPDLQIVINNSAISISKKIEVIEELFSNKIDRHLLNFIKILIEKNRFKEIEFIKETFDDEVSKLSNKLKVTITSPIELDFEMKTIIRLKLERKFNSEVIPEWKQDKSIIAGLIFQIGDCVIDTCLKSKLEKLSKEIVR